MGSNRENMISADFTEKQQGDALDSIKKLQAQFTFLLSLSTEDRKSLAKVSDEAMRDVFNMSH